MGGAAAEIIHGSPRGFAAGCRSHGGCPHHRSPVFLTCAEAALAHRSDYALGRTDAALPVRRPPSSASVLPDPAPSVEPRRVHGTISGYRRGCVADDLCPHRRVGAATCAEARRHYIAGYKRRRLEGVGTPVPHGTSNGYLLGCRDERGCPGIVSGRTCAGARADYRATRARAAGVSRAVAAVGAGDVHEKLQEWMRHGVSVRRIASVAGVSRTTVASIARGARDTVRASEETVRKLRALDWSSFSGRPSRAP